MKERQWFPIDEDIEERQVPQQESMDLQVMQRAVMQVADQAMEEVHVVEHAVMEEVHVVKHAVMEVVAEVTEEVHMDEQVVEVLTTPKKSVVRKKLTPKKSCDVITLYELVYLFGPCICFYF
jgi:hypothetical protein